MRQVRQVSDVSMVVQIIDRLVVAMKLPLSKFALLHHNFTLRRSTFFVTVEREQANHIAFLKRASLMGT